MEKLAFLNEIQYNIVPDLYALGRNFEYDQKDG